MTISLAHEWLNNAPTDKVLAAIGRAFLRSIPVLECDRILQGTAYRGVAFLNLAFRTSAVAWMATRMGRHFFLGTDIAHLVSAASPSDSECYHAKMAFVGNRDIYRLAEAAEILSAFLSDPKRDNSFAHQIIDKIAIQPPTSFQHDFTRYFAEDVASLNSYSAEVLTTQSLYGEDSSEYLALLDEATQKLIAYHKSWTTWIGWLRRKVEGKALEFEAERKFIEILYRYKGQRADTMLSSIFTAMERQPGAQLDPMVPLAPLSLPKQGPNPRFTARVDGVLDFAPLDALDSKGNNVAMLQLLHPQLVAIVRELEPLLREGNAPFRSLAERLVLYRESIDLALPEVNFGKAFVEGVRVGNAVDAVREEMSRGELPPFGPKIEEQVNSLISLHGAFILNTADGVALLAAEERYHRRPAEEAVFKWAAQQVASGLMRESKVMVPDAAQFVLNASQDIGMGKHSERSGVMGENVVRNAVIGAVGVAMLSTVPLSVGTAIGGAVGVAATTATFWSFSEALKKSKAGGALNEMLAKGIDRFTRQSLPTLFESGRQLLVPHLAFVKTVGPYLRLLAKNAKSMSWLDDSLDNLDVKRLTEEEEESFRKSALGQNSRG